MQQSLTATTPIHFLRSIIANGGPEVWEYETLNEVFDNLSLAHRNGRLTDAELALLQQGFGDECLENTLHGHIKTKPFGYAGDFLIIDKIYQEQITDDDRFAKWDLFWNNHSAAKAVRNRKDYFIQTVTQHLQEKRPLQLLNVASGPARDLAELYQLIDPQDLTTVCVEADQSAIQYASDLNKANAGRIRFVHQNIFRYGTTEQFDLVWSAGLFDYFDDAVFTRLLRRFIHWTRPGGEVVIGNFSNCNPSRAYMELVGDWFLQHRSAEKLRSLARAAGAPDYNISIGEESEGVNLFLHVRV